MSKDAENEGAAPRPRYRTGALFGTATAEVAVTRQSLGLAVVVDNGEPEESGCNPHYSGPLKLTVLIALFIEVIRRVRIIPVASSAVVLTRVHVCCGWVF
jgi:hypothetical protein